MRLKWVPFTRRALIVVGTIVALGGLALPVQADIGPKPTMDFTFEYEIDPVAIVGGELIECEDAACETGQPLEELGPQRFECTESACTSLAYGYAPYHKLVIEFADQTRESNVFTKDAFEATFQVTVTASSLAVEEVGGGLGGLQGCCSGLLFTLLLETLVAGIYVSAFHLPKSALAWVPLSSVLSLPVVWFAFPLLPVSAGWITLLAEMFAVLFEAGLVYLVTRGSMPFKHVAVLSLVMNATSFLFGLWM